MKTFDFSTVAFKLQFIGKTTRDDWECFEYRATVGKGSDAFSIPFRTGLGWVTKNRPFGTSQTVETRKEPTIKDVMSSLLMDARAGEDTFQDFCADFGYDPDSRKAFKTYLDCQDINQKMYRAFSADEIDEMSTALEDY